MDFRVNETGGVAVVVLGGRMDIDGAQSVDMQFNVLAGSKKRLVIDMGGVTFLASMGLRTLMTVVRSVSSKGGKVAIAGAQPGVAKVLDTSGLSGCGGRVRRLSWLRIERRIIGP